MTKSRFVLSLVAGLSFSTLALANSAPVKLSSFHSVGTAANATASHIGTKVTASPMLLGHVGNTSSLGVAHGTPSHRDGNWSTWHIQSEKPPQPLAAPEPGSLMLLSTGLVGLAGTVRRKLNR